MLNLSTNYQQMTSAADRAKLLKWKHAGMCSCPTRTALRLKLQMFRTKDDKVPFQHHLVMKNPAYWEYTPGYVYVDWGNAVYTALLIMIDQLSPIESSLFANLCQEKKGNMLECVLADWRERPMDVSQPVRVYP